MAFIPKGNQMINQFDHFQPLTEEEREVAEHEAAHAVMALAVPNDCVLADTLVFPTRDGRHMIGEVRHINLSSNPDRPYIYMPPFASTVPHKWQGAASLAYGALLVYYAGPAQTRIFFECSLDASGIRNEPCGESDNDNAAETCRHFWRPGSVESVLDCAAFVAGQMIQQPHFQQAIHALADFLTENKRRKATGMEASVIVRPYIPQQIAPPMLDHVLNLIKRHS
jgi:hypothetical protein